MASSEAKQHHVFWVEPQETRRTRLDDIEDRVCWPCTKHLTKGPCGSIMKRQLMNMMLLNDNEITYKQFATGHLQLVECWKKNKREYAEDLKKFPESQIESLKQVAAGELNID
jgi:hypothetical protein